MGDRSRSLDVVLKHGYAPKEQYARRGRQGPFTDIYALAATLYRVITGHVPPDSIERMEEDNLMSPSAMGCSLPAQAEDALLKALSVSAADRYQTMAQFKADLTSGSPAPQQTAANIIPPAPAVVQIPHSTAAVPQSTSDVTETSNMPAMNAMQQTAVQEDPAPQPMPQSPVLPVPKKDKKKWLLIGSISAVVIAAVLAIVLIIPQFFSSDMTKAKNALESGDYEGARELIEKMEQTEETKDLLKESYYLQAKDEMSAGDYTAALSTLEQVGDYKDSKTLIKQAHYNLGLSYIDKKDYVSAKSEFKLSGDYEDSAVMLNESDYLYAKQLVIEEEFDKAISIYRGLGLYKDSVTQLQKTHYLYGSYHLENKFYLSAIGEFEQCMGYDDADKLLKEAKYQYSKNSPMSSEVAYEYLSELKSANYKDSATIYKDRYTWKVIPVYANNSSSDETTLKSSVPSTCSYFHAGFKITGGIPGKMITMYAVSTFPSEGSYKSDWYWKNYKVGESCEIEWPNGFDAYSGTLTIAVYNKANDEKLGSLSIRLG